MVREALLKSPKWSKNLAVAFLGHVGATLGVRTDDKDAGTSLTQDSQTGKMVPVVPRSATDLNHGHARTEPLGGDHGPAKVRVLVGTLLLVLNKREIKTQKFYSLAYNRANFFQWLP
jgi:hypothetical protein